MIVKCLLFICVKMYLMVYFYTPTNDIYSILINFALTLIKNYLSLFLITFSLRNNNWINQNNSFKIDKTPNNHIIIMSFMESLTIYLIRMLIVFDKFNIYKEIIYCLFLRLLFDIFYDMIHYPIHYLFHKNNFLYENLHKYHHKYIISNVNAKFYNNFYDYLLTEFIPTIFSILLLRKLSNYLSYVFLMFLFIVKNMNDIIGHSGKITDIDNKKNYYHILTLTFLSSILGIMLVTKDHDYHHRNSKYNYSARTTILDKIFNTYKNNLNNKLIL